LRGEQVPTRGVAQNVERFLQVVAMLPAGSSVVAKMGDEVFEISGRKPDEGVATHAQLALRAKLMAIGGKRPPAKFEARAEGVRLFTLDVSEDVAQKIAPALYSELDIVARVHAA